MPGGQAVHDPRAVPSLLNLLLAMLQSLQSLDLDGLGNGIPVRQRRGAGPGRVRERVDGIVLDDLEQ